MKTVAYYQINRLSFTKLVTVKTAKTERYELISVSLRDKKTKIIVRSNDMDSTDKTRDFFICGISELEKIKEVSELEFTAFESLVNIAKRKEVYQKFAGSDTAKYQDFIKEERRELRYNSKGLTSFGRNVREAEQELKRLERQNQLDKKNKNGVNIPVASIGEVQTPHSKAA